MGSTRFGTVLTAMVTPFSPDGSVDLDVAATLAKFLVEEGTEGIVVAGSTGEGSALSDDEKLNLFACVAQAVNVPVLAGSTFANTAQSVALTKRVKDTGWRACSPRRPRTRVRASVASRLTSRRSLSARHCRSCSMTYLRAPGAKWRAPPRLIW